MSFRALILLKNREAVIREADATKPSFKFGGGLYIITETDIQNVRHDGEIHGAEAIYFEGNPCAVGYKKKETEESGKFLDEIVRMNALKQTSAGPRFDFSSSLAFLGALKSPVKIVYLLFFGVIAYALIAQALGWV